MEQVPPSSFPSPPFFLLPIPSFPFSDPVSFLPAAKRGSGGARNVTPYRNALTFLHVSSPAGPGGVLWCILSQNKYVRLQLTILVASDNERCCHLNIITECSEITFQIVKCHAEILSEQFLNSIMLCSLQKSLPYSAILQYWVNHFNSFKSQKNDLLKIKTMMSNHNSCQTLIKL